MTKPSTKDIAEKLIGHCRDGTEREALETLYAKDAVSVEAAPAPHTGSSVTEGVEGIRGKHDWWESEMEVNEASVEGPFMHGEDRFGVIFSITATERSSGNRQEMRELAIYTVSDGKIVREEFFYTM